MKETMITRSFITTIVRVVGKDETMCFPGMYRHQVTPLLQMQNLEIQSIKEELMRYGMTETTFLANAKPIIKQLNESVSEATIE